MDLFITGDEIWWWCSELMPSNSEVCYIRESLGSTGSHVFRIRFRNYIHWRLEEERAKLTYHTSSLQVAVLQRKNPDWDRIESSQDFRPSGYATEGGLQRWQQMFARRCSGIGNRKGLVYRFQVSQFQIRRVANEIHSKSLSRWAKHAPHLLSLSTMNL